MFEKDENYYPGGGYPQEQQDPTVADMAGDAASNAAYYAGIAADSGKNTIKKLLPLVVIGIILLAIIGGVVWWLGQNQTMNINIRGIDTLAIDTAKITILSSDNKPVYSKGGSDHSVQLQPGAYTVRVIAEGYNTETMSLQIPNEEGGKRINDLIIKLKKKLTSEIDVQFGHTEIFPTQQLSGVIIITNTSDEVIQDQPIMVKDTNGLEVVLTPDKFSVSAGGATSISFTVKQKVPVTEQKSATLTFSIKDTEFKDSFKINLMPYVPTKEIIFGTDIKNGKIEKTNLEAGTKTSITITIENKNKKIPLQNVNITISPLDDKDSDKIEWFGFAEASTNKNRFNIATINTASKETITINLQPNIDTVKDTEFYGILSITSLSMQSDQNFSMYAKVTKERKVGLVLQNIKTITIKCDKTTGICDNVSTTEVGALKNVGTEEIKGILKIGLDPVKSADEECDWVVVKTTSVSSIMPGASEKVLVEINPGTASVDQFACYLRWEYPNPLNVTEKIPELSDPIFVKIDKR